MDDDFFLDIKEEAPTKPVREVRIPEAYLKKINLKPKERTDEEWTKIFEFYPSCPDGYLKAYLPEEVEGYKAALKKYGFVVIKVLDAAQCDATAKEMFMDMNRRAQLAGHQKTPLVMDDPSTWEKVNFPSKSKFLASAPAFTQKAFENRTNPIIYNIFCNLFERKDLWCNIDNWGLFRGTKNLKFPDGTVQDRDDWRYNLKLHWDYNPWVLKKWDESGDAQMYQGLVALVDCLEEGSFSCVPCSTEFLKTWTSERPCPRMDRASMRVPDKDPMQKYIQKVPLRKGELVIWNSAQAHANYPNNCDKLRLHQFIRMLPSDIQSHCKDRYAPLRIIHKYRKDPFVKFTAEDLPFLSTLGRKLIGLELWADSERPSYWTKAMEVQKIHLGKEDDEKGEGEDEEEY